MNELQQYYLGSLSQRLEELEALHRALCEDPRPDDLATLRKIAHRLKGTGASYGFDAISEDAMALEAALDGVAGPWAPEVRKTLEAFLDTLRQTLAQGAPG